MLGRRQLQALVRLRAEQGGSGPTPALVFPSPRHRLSSEQRQPTGQDGPLLGPNQRAAPRTQRDLHLDSALESNRTGPTDASSDEELTTGVFTTELVCGFPAQPNEMRVSCGAKCTISQTEGLHSKAAPPASSAC